MTNCKRCICCDVEMFMLVVVIQSLDAHVPSSKRKKGEGSTALQLFFDRCRCGWVGVMPPSISPSVGPSSSVAYVSSFGSWTSAENQKKGRKARETRVCYDRPPSSSLLLLLLLSSSPSLSFGDMHGSCLSSKPVSPLILCV